MTERKLTVSAVALDLHGIRVLELVAPSALEPIRFRGKIRHRVGKHCVEIDAATWADTHQARVGYDWSAQPSARTVADVRAGALEVARDFLRAAGETPAEDLDTSTNTARGLLDELERDTVLRPGREQRRGRGFFYIPAQAR